MKNLYTIKFESDLDIPLLELGELINNNYSIVKLNELEQSPKIIQLQVDYLHEEYEGFPGIKLEEMSKE